MMMQLVVVVVVVEIVLYRDNRDNRDKIVEDGEFMKEIVTNWDKYIIGKYNN